MVAIHQVLPVFAPRDAIGNHTVAIRRALHQWGIESEIFAGEVMAGAGHGARTLRELGGRRGLAGGRSSARLGALEAARRLGRGGPGGQGRSQSKGRATTSGTDHTWLLYHASTGSSVADWFAARPEPKLVDYHNITPAELLGPWEPHIGVELEHGRRQLADLASVTEWALADSTFNADELIGLGFRHTSVVPILLDTDSLTGQADTEALTQLTQAKASRGGTEWLFISRLLPHKAHHDVIKAFAAYREVYDPAARLHLVGAVGSGRYADALTDFVQDLALDDAVDFTGSVSPGMLEALFDAADVYVGLSDHEGFGVPLLEALAHGVPVVTYACTAAVTETAGDGALVLDDKRPTTVAAAVHRLMSDRDLRDRLVDRGYGRVRHFDLATSTRRFRSAIEAILTDAGVGLPAGWPTSPPVPA
jgi:glycosyltransferase involved in cell wall biosynthesis